MRRMDVISVGVDQGTGMPVVVLRERAGRHRVLPIWIGAPEARAIEVERQQLSLPRPLTHAKECVTSS